MQAEEQQQAELEAWCEPDGEWQCLFAALWRVGLLNVSEWRCVLAVTGPLRCCLFTVPRTGPLAVHCKMVSSLFVG